MNIHTHINILSSTSSVVFDMFVCMRVCVCLCVCVCIYIYIYIYIHTHTYIHPYVHAYTLFLPQVLLCSEHLNEHNIRMHTCMHTHRQTVMHAAQNDS